MGVGDGYFNTVHGAQFGGDAVKAAREYLAKEGVHWSGVKILALKHRAGTAASRKAMSALNLGLAALENAAPREADGRLLTNGHRAWWKLRIIRHRPIKIERGFAWCITSRTIG